MRLPIFSDFGNTPALGVQWTLHTQTYQNTHLERVSHASALFHVLTCPNIWFTRLRPAFLSNSLFSFVSECLIKLIVQKIWISPVSITICVLWSPSCFCLGPTTFRSNGHLNLKRGHSLDSMCSHLAPNLLTKITGNHHSWESSFPRCQWWIQGAWAPPPPPPHPPFLDFF